MKMPKPLYLQLKEDLRKVAVEHYRVQDFASLDMASLWRLFHEVNAQRSYGEDHPRWRSIVRILEPTHVEGQGWIAHLYSQGLEDSHLSTALRTAQRELAEEALNAN